MSNRSTHKIFGYETKWKIYTVPSKISDVYIFCIIQKHLHFVYYSNAVFLSMCSIQYRIIPFVHNLEVFRLCVYCMYGNILYQYSVFLAGSLPSCQQVSTKSKVICMPLYTSPTSQTSCVFTRRFSTFVMFSFVYTCTKWCCEYFTNNGRVIYMAP